MPLRMAREGGSPGENPLASPETGLKHDACIAGGDAGNGSLLPVLVTVFSFRADQQQHGVVLWHGE